MTSKRQITTMRALDGNPFPDQAQVVKLVDDVQDARVSRKAGAESDHANWPKASKVCKLNQGFIKHPTICPGGEIGRHASFRC